MELTLTPRDISRVTFWHLIPVVWLLEIIGGFFLMFFIMKSLWDKRIPENIFGFVIGGYYASIEMALDNVTGGPINPARVFGPGIFSGKIFQFHIFITYMIAPVIGKCRPLCAIIRRLLPRRKVL